MRHIITLLTLFIISTLSHASSSLNVAVAGGFRPAMIDIEKAFTQKTGITLKTSYASVGALFAQIQHGAPFDVFISADTNTPKRLEEAGLALPGSRISHSISKLVLWSADSTLIDSQGHVLTTSRYQHLAIPNPKVGVHGRTALEAMKNMGIYEEVKTRLVEGKNALQTFEYVDTGVAELGFISYSLIYHQHKKIRGSYWIIPQTFYPPMIEQAVALKQAENNPQATQLLSFLTSEEGQKIIQAHGYDLPD
ncbi:molybdate ABC transporter substrate-binding protein [Vibrio viridaestus]|uniref:Molybdate ABC transporter substrate-binding protein n=1 Tax=Vibrio viridaestus TaxID=2487322 RepID=A0A3N9TJN8_9VIBR|nr:molybdate ABC transporter substrate-binding protein [Vibrio viridaestus]RQW64381.1 molybdate ABC transporter substrate-binding protein [Vibrio viridaestus]